MQVKSFGCSFISGTDLPDIADPGNYSLLTWPSLLAAQFGLPYRCHAGGGHGNLSILDRLSQEVQSDPTALFVIQWTYIDRFDYSDTKGHHFNGGTNDWSTICPGTDSEHGRMYFRDLHSEYRDKLTSLVYVKTALDILQTNQCKFFMTSLDRLLLCSQHHCSIAMKAWQKQLAANLCFFEDKDFLTWSQHKKFPVGDTGHPLEQAHSAAADLMHPVIDAILRKV